MNEKPGVLTFSNGVKIVPPELPSNDWGHAAVLQATQWFDMGAPLVEAVAMTANIFCDCKWSAVSEFREGWSKVKLVALVDDKKLTNCFEYEFQYTPCEEVLVKQQFGFFHNVQQSFPKDQDLADWGVADYAGQAFTDEKFELAGHLMVMHDQPINEESKVESIISALTTLLHLEWPVRHEKS